MKKSFPTLHVASTLTQICLCETGFRDVEHGACFSWILGYDIWLHEAWNHQVVAALRKNGYALFPDLPSPEEAAADYKSATAKALAAYGENIEVARGANERTESPIDTLHINKQRIIDVMVSKIEREKGFDA